MALWVGFDAHVERYLITYWHGGKSGDKYSRIPMQDRYTEASCWFSSSVVSGVSISLWPGDLLFCKRFDKWSNLQSWSKCLGWMRMIIRPSDINWWVFFKNVTSSPGPDMISIEMVYFACIEGINSSRTVFLEPTMRMSSMCTNIKQSPLAERSMDG